MRTRVVWHSLCVTVLLAAGAFDLSASGEDQPFVSADPVADRGVVMIGEEAPNFQLRDLDGAVVTLAQWCMP